MKVLMTTSVLPRWPGDATPPFVLNLAEDLVQLGCQITILAPHSPGAALRETVRGVAIERYPYLWPHRLQSLCYGGGMLVRLRGKRLRALQLPPFALAQSWATRRAIQRLRPDLLHSHSLLPQGLISEWVRPRDLPHVTTSHGSDVFGLKSHGWSGKAKAWVLRNVQAVTVNSSATEQAVRALAPVDDRIHRIPASPNEYPSDPQVVEQLRAASPGPRLLFVGRLIEDKGVRELLQSMPLLQKTHPAITAWIVGDGQDRAEFEGLTERLGLKAQVRFLGWLRGPELSNYYRAADLTVAPSRQRPGYVEAQGLSIAESLLQGTPCRDENGGIPDMVHTGINGILLEPNCDAEHLAAAINHAYKLPRQVAVFTQFERKYGRVAVAKGNLDLYQSLCVGHAARRAAHNCDSICYGLGPDAMKTDRKDSKR